MIFERVEREQKEYTDSLYRLTQGQLIAHAGEIEANRVCCNALLTAALDREQLILLLSEETPLASLREAWLAEQEAECGEAFSCVLSRHCEELRQQEEQEMTM